MSASCIFCRIASKELPAGIAFEDDDVLAFRDASPQAPTHVLVIPKRHIGTLDDLAETDAPLLGRMMLAAKQVAAEAGLGAGYRVVANCGAHGGQTVSHVHFHVLGGRRMSWPPG